MVKKIMITGATDGIGLATAKMLAAAGHHLLIHGRNRDKLTQVSQLLATIPGAGIIECYVADLSQLAQVKQLAQQTKADHDKLDVLINNAGVFKVNESITTDGLDVRFVVNTIAPYLLTQQLLPLLDAGGRVLNLSSAAQAAVDINALLGKVALTDMQAYAQSKLAITMWTIELAKTVNENGPALIAINPGSLLASKMVQDGFGVAGSDLDIGASILSAAALEPRFLTASGQYYDNDIGDFGLPHVDGLVPEKSSELVKVLDNLLADLFNEGLQS